MDELIKMIIEKTGISEANAQLSVETVVAFLKTKLPAPIAEQVEAVLKGGGAGGGLGDIAKGLGGLFGGKK